MSEKKNTRLKNTKKSAGKATLSTGANGPMDVELLQQIVQLMSANDLNTVDLRDGAKRVVLKRGAVQQSHQIMTHSPVTHHTHSSAPASAPAAATASPVVDEDAGLIAIKSPMVGTFYSKPSPDSKVFVTLGSRVDEETDVCVIEAMKVFNNIKAETRGTIAKILVADGQSVEFGTVLYLVKP